MTPTAYLASTWFDPRLTLGPSSIHGTGLFATARIRCAEVVMIWGGTLYTSNDLHTGQIPRGLSFSFIDDTLLLAGPADGLDYYVNHSCDPSVWMRDAVTVVARRDIHAGDEITGDYAIWESEPSYRIDSCHCGSALCRGVITGNDWMHPDLQTRYRGHFLPYIERRITAV